MHRFRTIIGVFLKYGYEDLAERLPLPSPLRLPFRKMRQAQEEISLLVARPNGCGAPSKNWGRPLSNWASFSPTRALLLPPPFIVELSKLHDQVPPIPFDRVLAVLNAELRRPVRRFFHFNRRGANRFGFDGAGASGRPAQWRKVRHQSAAAGY